jgi:hypothetical protein
LAPPVWRAAGGVLAWSAPGAPHYHRKVPEYWIVDPDARLIEGWRPGDTRPEIISETLTWHPHGAVRPFSLPIGPLFAEALGE